MSQSCIMNKTVILSLSNCCYWLLLYDRHVSSYINTGYACIILSSTVPLFNDSQKLAESLNIACQGGMSCLWLVCCAKRSAFSRAVSDLVHLYFGGPICLHFYNSWRPWWKFTTACCELLVTLEVKPTADNVWSLVFLEWTHPKKQISPSSDMRDLLRNGIPDSWLPGPCYNH